MGSGLGLDGEMEGGGQRDIEFWLKCGVRDVMRADSGSVFCAVCESLEGFDLIRGCCC